MPDLSLPRVPQVRGRPVRHQLGRPCMSSSWVALVCHRSRLHRRPPPIFPPLTMGTCAAAGAGGVGGRGGVKGRCRGPPVRRLAEEVHRLWAAHARACAREHRCAGVMLERACARIRWCAFLCACVHGRVRVQVCVHMRECKYVSVLPKHPPVHPSSEPRTRARERHRERDGVETRKGSPRPPPPLLILACYPPLHHRQQQPALAHGFADPHSR